MNKYFFFFFFLLIITPIYGLGIVSFNAWDLPDWITQDVSKPPSHPTIELSARMKAIGQYIVDHADHFDVIGFQEVWRADDRATILSYCQQVGLVHHLYYDYGILGSGLMTVSRYPIVHNHFIKYPLDGKPQRFFQGDWYTGKGVSYVRIQLPQEPYNSTLLHFFNTHTHSNYENGAPHDEYVAHRLDQIIRYSDTVNAQNYTDFDLVVAVGDFNAFIDSIEMRTFLYRTRMIVVPLEDPPITCSNGGRIDFINYQRNPVWLLEQNASHVFRGHGTYYSWIPAMDADYGLAPYYSDHLGVYANFTYNGIPYRHKPSTGPRNPYDETLLVVQDSLNEISWRLLFNTSTTIIVSFCVILVVLLVYVFDFSRWIIAIAVVALCLNYFDFYVHFIEYSVVSELEMKLSRIAQ